MDDAGEVKIWNGVSVVALWIKGIDIRRYIIVMLSHLFGRCEGVMSALLRWYGLLIAC